MNLAGFVNVLWPGTSVHDAVRVGVLWWINVAISNASEEWVVCLVWPVEVRHCLVALVEKDVCSTQPLFRETTNMLVHPSLSSSQEPEDALDDKVRDEPAQSTLSDRSVHICSFE